MNQSTDNVELDFLGLFLIIIFSMLWAFVLALGLTSAYDTFNFYTLKQDGFNISSNFENIGNVGGSLFATVLAFFIGFMLFGIIAHGIYTNQKMYLKKYIVMMATVTAFIAIFLVNFTAKEDLLVKSS